MRPELDTARGSKFIVMDAIVHAVLKKTVAIFYTFESIVRCGDAFSPPSQKAVGATTSFGKKRPRKQKNVYLRYGQRLPQKCSPGRARYILYIFILSHNIL